MKVCKVTKIGVPEEKKVGNFSLESYDEVAGISDEFNELILDAILKNKDIKLPVTYAKISVVPRLHENALALDFTQYTDSAACKYDDAGKSSMYIFEDEIVYVVTEVDFRLNEEPKINVDKKDELDRRAGQLLDAPKVDKDKSKIKRVSLPMSRKRKELLAKKAEIISLKKELYFARLQHTIDKSKEIKHTNG